MKKLLLHSCCAPCSSAVLERLINEGKWDITVLYYNPNIHPKEEYEKRKSEQIRLISSYYPNVKFLDCDYCSNEFFTAVKGYEKEKEGGDRCQICFKLRLSYTAKQAKKHGFDIFGTTLSVSPYKNAKLLNEIGIEIQKEMGVEYLVSDFKKQNGYLRSIQLSKQYDLYRQKYCGCVFSNNQG